MDVGAAKEGGQGRGGVNEDASEHACSLRRAEIVRPTRNEGCREAVSDCDGEEGDFWAWGRAD